MSTPAERYFRKIETDAYAKFFQMSTEAPEIISLVRNKWEKNRGVYDEATARIANEISSLGIDTTHGKPLIIAAAYKLVKLANKKIVSKQELDKEVRRVLLTCMYFGNPKDKCIELTASLARMKKDELENKFRDIDRVVQQLRQRSGGGGTTQPQI